VFLHEAVSGNDADHEKLREMVQAPAGALPRPRARGRIEKYRYKSPLILLASPQKTQARISSAISGFMATP